MHENKRSSHYTGYEYKDVTASQRMAPVYADGYENFGWSVNDPFDPLQGAGSVTLKFKRDRQLRNKAELTRLQRQFDSCVSDITALEGSKTQLASIVAYTVGLLGCAFMAGAMFSYLAGILPLMIVLAIPGVIGWGYLTLPSEERGTREPPRSHR